MRHRALPPLAVASVLVALAPAAATADPPATAVATADAAAREADRLTAAGDLPRALASYRSAAVADPRPLRLCALGLAHHRLGDAARALAFLDRCVGAGVATADARAARLRRHRELHDGELALVLISSEPPGAAVTASYLAGEPPLVAPLRLYLPRGSHRVTLRAAGAPPVDRLVEVAGRERIAVHAQLAVPAAAPAAPAAPPPTASIDFEADQPAVAELIAPPDPRRPQHRTLMPDRYAPPPPAASPGAPLADPDPDRAPSPTRPAPHRARSWILVGIGALAVAGGVALALAW